MSNWFGVSRKIYYTCCIIAPNLQNNGKSYALLSNETKYQTLQLTTNQFEYLHNLTFLCLHKTPHNGLGNILPTERRNIQIEICTKHREATSFATLIWGKFEWVDGSGISLSLKPRKHQAFSVRLNISSDNGDQTKRSP